MQGELHQHALAKVAHRGYENRAPGEAGVLHDLRQMLVFETQTIQLERRRLTFFVGLDHASPAARITRDGRQAERRVRRQQTRIHQGPDQCNRAGGITARVAHPARLSHPSSLANA